MKTRMLGMAAAVLVGLTACSEDGTTDPPPTPTVTVALPTASGQITQAGTLAVPVNITRGGGFAGAVTLAVSGVNGITATGTSIAANATSATLTLTADAAAAPGAGTLTITATGPNNTPTASATFALTVNVRGTYTLASNPATLPLVQGTSGSAQIAVNRAGGFAGAVALTAQAPAGLTVTLTPASVSGTTAASTLAVAASGTLAAGTYPITITGTTPGLANQTTTTSVVVTAAGSYTMAVAPTTVPVQAGQSGTANVTITRLNNFAGTVNLAATAPAGITVTPNPAAVTGTTSALTIAVAANVAAGNHTVTLTGTATGLPNQTAILTVNVTAAPTGSFSLAIAPSTVTIQAGLSGTANVTITRVAPFTGTVNLAATAPAGITVTPNPAAATAGTAVLNIAVAANVAAGNHTITLNGTATGVANQSATVTVNVTAAPAGSFTLALNPTTLAVQQGGNNTSTVTITRIGGFTGDVALTATTPSGVTASFNPATLSGATTTSTMTLTASASATTGAGQVTVRGNATGQTEQTATLALTVNPSQGGSGNVTFTFCGESGLPLWVAVQDGDGAWVRVTGNANNQFTFQISQGRGGVMYVTPEGTGFDTQVFYGTTAELQGMGANLCFGTTGTGKTITGTASGITPPLELGFLTLGQSTAEFNANMTSFTFNNVLEGALDMVGSRVTFDLLTGAITPNALIIQRNLNIANNGSVGAVNFAAGVAPATAQLTFANAGTDWTGAIGLYYTPRNTFGLLFTGGGQTAQATLPWYGFPAASMQAGELHVINAFATVPPTGGTVTQTRQIMFVTANVANRTVTFGAVLNAPTVAVAATTPYVRLRIDHTPQTDYDDYFVASFQQGSTATLRLVTIQKTAAYVSAGGVARLEVPDVSAAAGWTNTWALQTGALTTWTFTASSWSGGNGITAPFFVEGSTLLSATRTGQITP